MRRAVGRDCRQIASRVEIDETTLASGCWSGPSTMSSTPLPADVASTSRDASESQIDTDACGCSRRERFGVIETVCFM